MGNTRPTQEEYFTMGQQIRDDIGNKRVLICPVDHGAYADSLFMMEPLRDAGVNALYYERGPYTHRSKIAQYAKDFFRESFRD